MNAFLTRNKRGIWQLAAVVWIIALACGSTMAADKAVLRSNSDGTFTGPCCSSWDESVTVYEAGNLVPVMVTWSTDYQSNAPFIVGLRVNGGPCTMFGAGSMTAQSPGDGMYMASASFQWVILPGDYGLRSGPNVLTLCGGGVSGDTDRITIWGNTLLAHLER